MEQKITVKEAGREDIPVILEFIRGLAEYEKLKHEVTADEETLRREMFDKGGARALIALCGKTPCGFALYFYSFSTFLGKRGIYLEDLFVRPDFRGRGVGSKLLCELAQIAVREGCGRLEWSCLDWNTSSVEFYKSRGARPMDGWTVYRMTGDRLTALAESVGDGK